MGRTDDITGEAVLAALECRESRKAEQSVLSRHVGGLKRAGGKAVRAADVDDSTLLATAMAQEYRWTMATSWP